MKIVICMDSWKGSLTALQACQAVREGILSVAADAEVPMCPMADGGEGTLEIVGAQRPGTRIVKEVTGPLPDMRVRGEYLWWPEEKEALVEMAVCAGLTLLSEKARDPLRTTTRGVGELVADAMRRGAEKISLAVGGSATVDGGSGMAMALGWRLLDEAGNPIPDGGAGLARLRHLQPPPELNANVPKVEVLCDVTNPLLGPRGAAAVFAPQKGADPKAVRELEAALSVFERVLREDLKKNLGDIPGTGAAGGLSAGAMAFLDAVLVEGIDAVIQLTGLAAKAEGADWLITGEGRLDDQSVDGKVVSGISRLARSSGSKVAVIAGSCALSDASLSRAGIHRAYAANVNRRPLKEALEHAYDWARAAGQKFARENIS